MPPFVKPKTKTTAWPCTASSIVVGQAAEAGQLMDVDWTSWNEAVVDLGDGPDRVVVYTWNVELDDRTQRYGGWVPSRP